MKARTHSLDADKSVSQIWFTSLLRGSWGPPATADTGNSRSMLGACMGTRVCAAWVAQYAQSTLATMASDKASPEQCF
jgi:hypothetical protein